MQRVGQAGLSEAASMIAHDWPGGRRRGSSKVPRAVTLCLSCASLPFATLAQQTATLPEVTVNAPSGAVSSFDEVGSVDRGEGDELRDSRLQLNLSEGLGAVPACKSRTARTMRRTCSWRCGASVRARPSACGAFVFAWTAYLRRCRMARVTLRYRFGRPGRDPARAVFGAVWQFVGRRAARVH